MFHLRVFQIDQTCIANWNMRVNNIVSSDSANCHRSDTSCSVQRSLHNGPPADKADTRKPRGSQVTEDEDI